MDTIPSLFSELPEELVVRIISFLPVVSRVHLSVLSKSLSAKVATPSLWEKIIIPDEAPSLDIAVRAIPRRVAGPVVVAFRGGQHFSDGARRSAAPWQTAPGLHLARPVILEPLTPSDEVRLSSAHSRPVLTLLPGSAGSILRNMHLVTEHYASHCVEIKGASGVQVVGCMLTASGRASYGLVIHAASGVSISGCVVAHCGGGGILLSDGSGPVTASNMTVRSCQWSGLTLGAKASLSMTDCSIVQNKGFGLNVAFNSSLDLDNLSSVAGNGMGQKHTFLAS